jgi:S1-C subfamily serine protease
MVHSHANQRQLLRDIRHAAAVAVLATSTFTFASASQQSPATSDLRLLSAVVGVGGSVANGRYVLGEERAAFSRTDDKELIASFEWQGTPGVHRMVATWHGPDGTVSSSAPIDYQAKDRRFGAYWRFSVSPTMSLGNWSVDVTVDGQPGGRIGFEIKGEAAAPGVIRKRVLTPAQLFDALNGLHVILQRSTSAGKALEPAAALRGPNGYLHTVTSAIDEADKIQAYPADGKAQPVTAVMAWNRAGGWAVLSAGDTQPPPPQQAIARQDDIRIGDRCYAVDGSPTGARVLLDGVISGRTGGARPAWIVTFQTGFARAGSAVINESGEILGIVDSPTNMFESLKAQEDLRGRRLIDVAEFRVPENVSARSLDDMRARGELLAPVLGEMHVMSAGFAAGINRGPPVAVEDQRSEFSTTEKTFTVFVNWNPRERLKGMASLKLYNADNRQLVQSPPKKADIKKQDLILMSWRFDMLRTPGIYRADVLMDDKVMWRGWVRVTP